MKKKVLLFNAASDNRYFLSAQAPLGVLYLASYLRREGQESAVCDLNVRRNWRRTAARAVKEFDPDIVGISSNFSNRRETLEAAEIVKKTRQKAVVVVGGPHPTAAPQEYGQPAVDYIIPYEAEKVMADFVRAGGTELVPGALRAGMPDIEHARRSMSRSVVENLDELPFPAYDMIDIRPYYINTYKKRPIVSIFTSRGCPHSCIFCCQEVSGRRWRPRSAGNVVDEMLWLRDTIGAREISVEDDNFTADVDRAFRICELMKRKKVCVPWQLSNGIRADRITRELLKAMKDAGCWKIAIAPEVGDEESMRAIGKGIPLDKFRQAARWCKELGIVFFGFFLMGFPFQERKHMQDIIDFALELDPLFMDLSKIVPFPGTRVFEENKAHRAYSEAVISYYYRGTDDLLEEMYKKAYLAFYGRPKKMFEIISTVDFRQLFNFAVYGGRVFLSKKTSFSDPVLS